MSPKKKPTHLSNQEFLLMIIPVILALLVVAFTVGLYVSQRIANDDVFSSRTSDADVAMDNETEDTAEEVVEENTASWESLPDLGEAPLAETGEIEINWLDEPIDITDELETEPWFSEVALDNTEDVYFGEASYRKYSLGSVSSTGLYVDYSLSLIEESVPGMGGDYTYDFYVLEREGEDLVFLREESDDYSDRHNFFTKYFVFDTNSTIPALNSPEEIVFPSGNTFVQLSPRGFGNLSFEQQLNKEFGDAIGTTNGLTLFAAPGESNGIYMYRRPDGRLVEYVFQWPFWDNSASREAQELILDTDSGEFSGSYVHNSFGGCGMGGLNITDFVPEDPARVQPLGVLDGYQIYELSEAGYAEKLTELTTWLRMNDDKTADDFFALKPFLYVQDFEGNWIELTHIEVVPPAECGKPVIYLYPEEETDVLVELELEGGFTKVDPPYNDGWRVTASPDGSLYNKDDGKIYPYLFWEGHGGAYEAPEYYWVMSREEVPKIVGKLLAEFGLNGQEIYDFMEFWIPLMEDAPYYKVGFHGTRMMDQLAPLTVTPRPDSVFRILMDYMELQEPVPANPLPHIIPFEREGFSVVEWGGVLQIEDKIQ